MLQCAKKALKNKKRQNSTVRRWCGTGMPYMTTTPQSSCYFTIKHEKPDRKPFCCVRNRQGMVQSRKTSVKNGKIAPDWGAITHAPHKTIPLIMTSYFTSGHKKRDQKTLYPARKQAKPVKFLEKRQKTTAKQHLVGVVYSTRVTNIAASLVCCHFTNLHGKPDQKTFYRARKQ